ncbi:MAG: IS110 family transposase [Deltaproteobacteria bacterium]|nr:IS110 family transposase [Deltaproteobacteria bacterium]
MELLYQHCGGLDVHKRTITACVRLLREDGSIQQETRTFGTMTRDLLELADWLTAADVTHVALESTGSYWKPVYNILEGKFTLVLVNARHVKHVPGRKTDVQDCQWLAQLLQAGLLRGSFIPPRPQRELRDLTRHRSQLVAEKNRVANRIQKILEDANIKLASVATDILGASGRDMLRALIRGETDCEKMADLARRQLRTKIPQLRPALEGQVTDHHRFMLGELLNHLEYLESRIEEFSRRIEEVSRPFAPAMAKVATLPGFDQRSAQNVVAEIGADMDVFPSAPHLASWAGVCPGNNESAGKRKSGRTTKGNRWLRAALSQAAWSAARKKDSYFQAQYRRLTGRRGKKRAIVAVAHSLLTIIYHMLTNASDYRELGGGYLDKRNAHRLLPKLLRRIRDMGYQVTLQEAA